MAHSSSDELWLKAARYSIQQSNYLTANVDFDNVNAHIFNTLQYFIISDEIRQAELQLRTSAYDYFTLVRSRWMKGPSDPQVMAAKAAAIEALDHLDDLLKTAPSSDLAKALGIGLS
ncbi:hypothetical protein L1787_16760 [Acuticoccus sp. M5D2P5]|uniref:hypothetical protein n=1 Tax=Acuticoccus kalidii TaxID=2910977 RepID=UPI001F435B75|nr:hypothetical protein [Acuticoccus kalidii]MCF3935057.1 hypothetical protein [Acuticoccus kalidii]